jgi:hypothetical protein
MPAISPEAERLSGCRSQVHTDSLTVTLDLRRLGPGVGDAVLRALGLPQHPDGALMPAQDPISFHEGVRTAFANIARTDGIDALEFATVISAFIHECRHVHDMRATRCGAELLLHDIEVYSGVRHLLDRLADWQRETGRPLPLPLTAGLDRFDGAGPAIRERIEPAVRQRAFVERRWTARSTGPNIPGHSIRALFEALGFYIQLEWLDATFGDDIAERIAYGGADQNAVMTKYMRPSFVLASSMQRAGATPDPEIQDLSCLITAALTFSGIDDAFADDVPTRSHPGTWFDRLAAAYAQVVVSPDVDRQDSARVAVEWLADQAGLGDAAERYARANDAISQLHDSTLHSLADEGILGGVQRYEGLLLATEVAIDFRDMQRVLSTMPIYHAPIGYVALLMAGELTSVYVRVRTPDGTAGDFRTPSATPANHIGGSRAASEASQQMRLLLARPNLANVTFFEHEVGHRLRAQPPDGRGLRFRVTA